MKIRHPEKIKNPINPIKRKPDWIKSKLVNSKEFFTTKSLINKSKLVTVCEEANCPNITECWSKKHATFMIMGDTCTRACAFCDGPLAPPHQSADLGIEADVDRIRQVLPPTGGLAALAARHTLAAKATAQRSHRTARGA